IIEMGQLYLQHTLSGSRTFAKNFQNQRRPVQHLSAGLLFEITLLDGAERRVDKEEIDVLFLDASGQFLDMTAAHEGRGLYLADLDGFGKDDVETNGACQTLELSLPRLDAAVHPDATHFGANQARAGRMLALVDEGLGSTQAVFVLVKMIHIVPSVVVGVLLGIEQLDGRARHDGRDSVL